MFLFFDTETTGLPKNFKAPVTDTKNWPRMVQVAWQSYDNDGKKSDIQDFIIKPEGFTIPADASKIHRISTQRAIDEGEELETVLHLFNEQIEKASFLVAHNINFDEKIIGAEFIRKQIKSNLFNKQKICTMQSSTDYCMIPGPYGFKWPKLEELYKILFDEYFEEAHDAAADINATVKCFWELKKRGILKL